MKTMSEEDMDEFMNNFVGEIDEEKLKKQTKEMEKEILGDIDLGIFPYLPYLFIVLVGVFGLHSFFISIPKIWLIVSSVLLSIAGAVLSYLLLGMYSMLALQQEAGRGLMDALINNQEKKENDPDYFG